MGAVNKEQERAARAALESALRRCAEVVREADPSLGAEAIRARHKEFDELWSLAVKSVRRAHGAWATNWALQQMGRDEDMRLVDEELPRSEE
jgi:hypothetical protein